MEEKLVTVEKTEKDKERAKRLKAKAKAAKKANKTYTNPYKTTWGKILVFALCAFMTLTTFVSLIVILVKLINKV